MIYYLYRVSVHLLTQEQICVQLLILVNNRIAVNTGNQYMVVLKNAWEAKMGKLGDMGQRTMALNTKSKSWVC
jgi:hypothetical protein